ncbi:hypothetical protein ACFLZN_01775 [Nanoarchaeota archaeon]
MKLLTRTQISHNPDLNNSEGVEEILTGIDFKAIHDMGLTSRINVETRFEGVTDMREEYTGTVYIGRQRERPEGAIDAEILPHIEDILLPKPKIILWSARDNSYILPDDRIGAKRLFSPPAKLLFDLHAKTGAEYEGLIAWNNIVLPLIFRRTFDSWSRGGTATLKLYFAEREFSDPQLTLDESGTRVYSSELCDKLKFLEEF